MFITALFIIARTWKQPRCPSADEWIRKLWYIYTMEYYSAIIKNTFESVLMRWMKLEPIIQSEVSQKEKHQYSIFIFYTHTLNYKWNKTPLWNFFTIQTWIFLITFWVRRVTDILFHALCHHVMVSSCFLKELVTFVSRFFPQVLTHFACFDADTFDFMHMKILKSHISEEPRWRRSRTGRTLSPPQIHQKSI